MSKWIKNDSGVDKTWEGQLVSDQTYYEIESSEELQWKNSSTLLVDISSGNAIVAKDNSGTEDIIDVNTAINYLKDIHTITEVDTEGRQITRVAYGKKGWSYFAHPVEFTTSKLSSLFTEDWLGVDRGTSMVKFYKADGTELTTQLDITTYCVETRLTISPDVDYEVISGTVDIHELIAEDVRMYVLGGIIDSTTNSPWEYPTSSGVYHIKEFTGGINFKYIGVDQKVETDGRTAKYMTKTTPGVPFNTNQFQIIMKHPVGSQHDFMVTLEYFRA